MPDQTKPNQSLKRLARVDSAHRVSLGDLPPDAVSTADAKAIAGVFSDEVQQRVQRQALDLRATLSVGATLSRQPVLWLVLLLARHRPLHVNSFLRRSAGNPPVYWRKNTHIYHG